MLKYLFIILLFIATCSSVCKPVVPGKGVILLTFNGYPSENGKFSWQPSYILQPDRIDIQLMVYHYFDNWNIVITTDDSLFYTYPIDKRIRCVITSDTLILNGNNSGGVASVDALEKGDTSSTIISCPNLGYNNRDIADCIAHEVGHELGLNHQVYWRDGRFIHEYDMGTWDEAPIMGCSYHAKKAVWRTGYVKDGSIQNDTLMISRTFSRIK